MAIHEQISAPFQICESEMLVDLVSGQEREVDIVIRAAVASYNVVISVECTDRSRPASVEWVEQMCCKHRSLPTQKLVLVSKTGFTPNATAKARTFGAEALALDVARNVSWAKYVDRQAKLFFAAIDTLTVVIPSSPTYTSKSPYQGIPMSTRFFDPDGQYRATAKEIANFLLSKESILSATIAKMDVADGEGWEISTGMKPGVRMCLPNGEQHEVKELNVFLIADPLLVRFELERATFRDMQVAYGNSKSEKGEFLLTILEAKEGAPMAQVRIRRPWGEVQTYPLAGNLEDQPSAASDDAMRALIGGTSGAE